VGTGNAGIRRVDGPGRRAGQPEIQGVAPATGLAGLLFLPRACLPIVYFLSNPSAVKVDCFPIETVGSSLNHAGQGILSQNATLHALATVSCSLTALHYGNP